MLGKLPTELHPSLGKLFSFVYVDLKPRQSYVEALQPRRCPTIQMGQAQADTPDSRVHMEDALTWSRAQFL